MPNYGIVLPTRASAMESNDTSELTAKTVSDILHLSTTAEAVGFDSIWVGDSVLAKPRHEPLSTLAAVASVTDRVQLGTSVYLPPIRNPVHVAHQAITVDLISGGRLSLGVGTGTAGEMGSSVRSEFAELDTPWEKRGEILDEHLAVLTGLLDGESVSYEGDHYQFDDVSIGMQPCGDVPIYIGSSIHPDKGLLRVIRDRIVNYGDGWLPGVRSPDDYSLGLDQIEEDLTAADRSFAKFDRLCYRDVIVEEDEEKALERERDFLERYYPGYEPSRDEIEGRCLFGPVEKIEEDLNRFADAGVEHFTLRITGQNQLDQVRKLSPIVN